MSKNLSDGKKIKAKAKQIAATGGKAIKQKDTWKKVGAIACGTMLASVGVAVSNRVVGLVTTNRTARYAGGSVAAGFVSMICFGVNWNYVGFGAASTTAIQVLNTAFSATVGKSLAEFVS